ncbi:hypothetical protein ABBQ32_010068 [Trebouxia sp. C0010 RCD-2024]
MFRGRKGSAAGTGDVMGSHVNRDGAAPDMAIYGGNAFGHSVSPTAHLLADPAPIGLFMFGLASALSAGNYLRWTPASISYVIFTFTFVSGGLIPLVVSLLEIIRNNMFAAVTFATYGSFFLSYTFFGLMYATGQFPALLRDGLPLEGLQFALLMYALLSVVFIGLSIRMNFALTCLFTSIALAYFCLAIGLTHDERRVSKAGGYFSICVCITTWWLAIAELVFDVTGKPYVPVFWYPWGQDQKMHSAMSSRRALDPHVQAAIAESHSKRNLKVNRQAPVPANNGGTDGQSVV